jgi:hypothetical protein
MDIEHTAESQAADALLNERISEHSTSAAGPEEGDEARRKRLAEYEMAGLERPDPGDACLAAVTADLIGIAYELGGAVQQSLAAEPATTESARRGEAALNNYLRVTRQIAQFVQLDVRAAEARQEAASANITLQAMALQGQIKHATSRSVRSIPGDW